MESDPKLLQFYKSKGVTPKIYALPLMETAFSEVLDEQLWLQLWDHIVTNEPYFMIFVIVAYNSALRLTVMRYDEVTSIEKIFREQNYVNFKKLITKAYRLMENCSSNIHPKRYMKPFVPLARGEYQTFENYPKNVSDLKVNEIDTLREEQKMLDAKLAEMESFEKTINSRMESYLMDEEYAKRMKGEPYTKSFFWSIDIGGWLITFYVSPDNIANNAQWWLIAFCFGNSGQNCYATTRRSEIFQTHVSKFWALNPATLSTSAV